MTQAEVITETPSVARTVDCSTIPIVLGVTGHIDLDPDYSEALHATLRRVFDDFRDRYPNTERVLLSSLAAGADQLVAEAALEADMRLVVPLPFPAEIYAQSSAFKDNPDARDRMLEYIKRSDITSFVVPLPELIAENNTAAWLKVISDADQRRRGYANAGGYITRHCQGLIAMWNGAPPDKPSGTSEMVSCKLFGTTPALYPWPRPLLLRADGGPVYVVHTPRLSEREQTTSKDFKPGALRVLLPPKGEPCRKDIFDWRSTRFGRFLDRLGQVIGFGKPEETTTPWNDFHGVCQMIDDFNSEVDRNGSLVARIERAKRTLLWHWSDSGRVPSNLQRLMILRKAAAVLATNVEFPADLATILLFGLLFLAGVSFHVYAHWEHHGDHRPLWLAFFIGCLFLAAVVVGISWFFRWNERRLDYRALAEALRVRIFWGVAGIGESVADSYLGQMRNEMVWVRRALQSSAAPPLNWKRAFDTLHVDQKLEQLSTVAKDWVISQANYFKKQVRKHHGAATCYRSAGFFAACIGWCAALVLLFSWPLHLGSPRANHGDREPGREVSRVAHPRPVSENGSLIDAIFQSIDSVHPDRYMLVFSGALVLGGGLLVAFCERRCHEELAKQYERMAAIFLQGTIELLAALDKGDIDGAQDVLKALGQEAIMENAQWLVLRRNRPFELLII